MVTKERVIEGMMKLLDLFAKEYSQQTKAEAKQGVEQLFVNDVQAYNSLLETLFGIDDNFTMSIEEYAKERYKNDWK